MKKISLVIVVALAVLLIVAAAPAVSASDIIIDNHYVEYTDQTQTLKIVYKYSAQDPLQFNAPLNFLMAQQIQDIDQLSYIVCRLAGQRSSIPEGRTESTYVIKDASGNILKSDNVVIYKSYRKNLAGTITHTEFLIFPQNWDNTGLSGRYKIEFGFNFVDKIFAWRVFGTEEGSSNIRFAHPQANYIMFSNIQLPNGDFLNPEITVVSFSSWKTDLQVIKNPDSPNTHYNVILNRSANTGLLTLNDTDDNIIFSDATGNDINYPVLQTLLGKITLVSPTKTYTEILQNGSGTGVPGSGTGVPVTVYVKNSQTGALIADANIVIDALVNGEYYPVVNRTEPSGIFSVTLQPTGGGQPNPDGYRLIATADGYNNPMPEINFTVDDYKLSIHCLLDPIAGGPLNENKTFIDFFVRDMSSNPIPGATVKFGKYTLITNSQGYTVFEVDKNNNYAWTISKSGYGPLTGNAVIGTAPRHTINTVLAPAVTPATHTPIPTGTVIGPKPTMTAPTGEPVSNWLEWFAAHFGMILGGGAEIGKIFMWICFAVPVGVYVGKEAKAGAAGFMAGAGVVTLFFVLIGWVPIWLMVLLALIIGLLYAKVLNTQDNGGGR